MIWMDKNIRIFYNNKGVGGRRVVGKGQVLVFTLCFFFVRVQG